MLRILRGSPFAGLHPSARSLLCPADAVFFGRRFIVFVLAGSGLLMAPSAANPAGQITIYGANSSTRLTLTKKGPGLVVKGTMAGEHQDGCRFIRAHRVAVCRLAGASRIEVTMGPSNDRVIVADPMPVPLTAYLGAGSDKFIGNDEPDTCYSQGTKRNRCIGHGGNDVCITGQKNSDCVGDAGNDYCHHGAGSDGCWGGPGATSASWAPARTVATAKAATTASTAVPTPTSSTAAPASTTATGFPASAAPTTATPARATRHGGSVGRIRR